MKHAACTMFTIRHAVAADTGALAEIERSASEAFLHLDDYAALATGDVMPEARQRELIAAGAVWVTTDGSGALVAFLSAERIGPRLHIWELSVLRTLQGRGLGRSLIAEAAGWASLQGLSALTLTTFCDVPWNAPFYGRLGFKALAPGELTPELRGILEDEARHGLPSDKRCAMVLACS